MQDPRDGELDLGRPPGGKSLFRLFQLLYSAGLGARADELLAAAIPDDQRETFEDRWSQMSAAPGALEAEAEGPEAGEVSPPDATEVAQLYAETANTLAQQAVPAAAAQWRSLGPWTIPNGQTYGASRVNVSGRVSAIAVDPEDPAHVLVGAANGGVWESRDRGGSWSPRTDHAATLTVGALSFDPSNPARVLCGTGEGNWWSYLGAGVLESTDGGTTWTTLCTNPFVGQGFYDLVIDRQNGSHLIAATTAGLYTSVDSGISWTQQRNVRTWSLASSPSGDELLAGCQDGVFASADGGITWTGVALPGTPGAFDRIAVAIAPSNPAVAYAWAARGSTPYLWRRSAGAWSVVGPPPGVSTGQAWYDWFVAAAPDRDSQVFCGAIDAYRGDLSATGWSWLDITSKGSGDSIHPDQHAIAFEPGDPDVIYVGNDGGLFTSPDRGVTWQHLNHGLVISEFEYLAQDPGSPVWLIGGTQDNGTDRWTGMVNWDHVADGDGGDCAVDQRNPQIVWHTYYGMSPEISHSHGDWGAWAAASPPVPAGEGSLFYPPVETSLGNGETFAIGGAALYVSRDNAATWTRLPFPNPAFASALAIPNPDTVYVGTTDGRIFATRWSGAAWNALTAFTSPRAGAYVSDILADVVGAVVWVTYRTFGGGRVFRSADGGGTWADLTAGLPNLPINAIEVDPRDATRVWVAADLGVYESRDAGSTWSSYSNGLPNAYVGDLLFNPSSRALRAGTRNRGVWEIQVDSGQVTTAPLYRYWNPQIGDHFYTTNYAELGAGKSGWNYEGIQCWVCLTPIPTAVPLYRYWNPGGGDHFYTTNWGELQVGNYGWNLEGIQCYVLMGPTANAVPLYRYWNPQIVDHFYTTNWNELGGGNYGWKLEGIACYVLASPAAPGLAAEMKQLTPSTFATEGAATPGTAPPTSFTIGASTARAATPPPSFELADETSSPALGEQARPRRQGA